MKSSLKQGNSDLQSKLTLTGRAVLELVERKGLEALSIAAVARAAKLSPVWVKKNVGATQSALIKFAIKHYGLWLSHLELLHHSTHAEELIADKERGLSLFLDNMLGFPSLVKIYFRHRGQSSSMGRQIAKVEGLYLKMSAERIRAALGCTENEATRLARHVLALDMTLAWDWVHFPTDKEALIDQAIRIFRAMIQ